ncbi:polysaccharide biosynthesis/export family protein [Asticcacaulis sp. AND118]|uniref:polysaccharide biosynthesis/export family protein n=1 Tax=Asticcacaulis sp. AND118 TaxID=2840468 RepID=UPI001CFFB00B|nr:polysaccharide biosynthesis/export family protein [Asticcacaulis sp. AND118]UDF05058.1 polysaccharide export protein [Asticcacaulis sp. AND118]
MRRILLLALAICLPVTVQTQAQTRPASAVEGQERVYRLGSGDKVRVTVYGEPDLSGEFAVDGTGSVSIPLIGEVSAQGLTVADFRAAVENKFKDGYLLNPRVSAEVTNYRPYYIMGEVGKAGEYPYVDGLSVVNAIARAEGFTYRAQQKRIFIKSYGSEQETEVMLSPELRVYPGDTIRIAERHF